MLRWYPIEKDYKNNQMQNNVNSSIISCLIALFHYANLVFSGSRFTIYIIIKVAANFAVIIPFQEKKSEIFLIVVHFKLADQKSKEISTNCTDINFGTKQNMVYRSKKVLSLIIAPYSNSSTVNLDQQTILYTQQLFFF